MFDYSKKRKPIVLTDFYDSLRENIVIHDIRIAESEFNSSKAGVVLLRGTNKIERITLEKIKFSTRAFSTFALGLSNLNNLNQICIKTNVSEYPNLAFLYITFQKYGLNLNLERLIFELRYSKDVRKYELLKKNFVGSKLIDLDISHSYRLITKESESKSSWKLLLQKAAKKHSKDSPAYVSNGVPAGDDGFDFMYQLIFNEQFSITRTVIKH